MFITLMILIWLGCIPLGYLACRWTGRVIDTRWTRNDRLWAIIFSLIFGPLMIAITVVSVLLHKLLMSDWGNKEVKW